MKPEQVPCKKCGRPFVSQKVFQQIRTVIREKKLGSFADRYELCQQCRTRAFAEGLLGNNVETVPKVKHVAKRRSEKLEPVKVDPRSGATVFKSQCYSCNSGCDVLVSVKEGRVTKVEGDPSSPVTKGTLCAKGLASRHVLYHPERLTYPMKRMGERGEGKWQRVSWDEALDTAARRFKEIQARYGKYSTALATGTMRGWMWHFYRFGNALGWQRTGPGLAQCATPRNTASTLVTGGLAPECPYYDSTQCMLIWGANPLATFPPKALGIMEARARGAKLIVVDPVLTETSSKADIWLQLRPGTDAALALGMLQVTINEGLYDKQFVKKWCLGFDELKERVQGYPPEKVEQITWVPRGKILEAARTYALSRPASITQALAIDQNADTISTSRSIAMLASITGNIDVHGGNVFTMKTGVPPPNVMTLRQRLTREDHEMRLGSKEYPLLAGEPARSLPSAHNATLWKAILTGRPYPVRAVYCQGNNMALSYANTKMVTEALRSLDFFVVVDLFMTQTSELADLLLPAATWLERDAITPSHQTSYNHIHLQQKVVEVEDCWSDYKILNELAKRLGVGELMFSSEEEYCDYLLKDTGLTFKEFKKRGIVSVPFTYRKYERDGFATPSGRIELYSQGLKDLGFDPLPSYREPTESPFSTPELATEYPLILTTGAREPVFRHSELRNIPVLRQIWPEPRMKINPKTASAMGIKEGDTAIVETLRGSVEAKAWLREDIDPRVVHVPSHWPGKNNVNLITDNEQCAPMIGSAQLRCQLCRVRRAE
ncbi:MAG: molybdopterin-dependent oxidoreductase [Deltaproteobacteria bacterium]|nr:MAG: molybdopterin-dependent oxidoreductase [Deltaproteobacteria bacterium]